MRLKFLRRIFGRACRREFQNLLSPYLDGELDDRSRQRLEAHLRECAACRAVLEEISFASDFVSRLELPEKVPTGFPLWLKQEKPGRNFQEKSSKTAFFNENH